MINFKFKILNFKFRKAVWLENKKEVEVHNSHGLGYKFSSSDHLDIMVIPGITP